MSVSTSTVSLHGRQFLVGIWSDITERKRAAAALLESEQRFRSLIESAPEAVFVQRGGRFLYLNPAACRLFGASRPEELIGMDFVERLAPEYHDHVRKRIRLQRESGAPAPLMEQEYLRLDGTRVPVETTAVFVRYEDHDAHIVFVRDITERKRTEQALRESERKFSTIFRVAPVGISITRPVDGRFMDFNDGFESITGYSRDDVLGRTSVELGLWVDPGDRNRMLAAVRREGRVRDFEAQVRGKSGDCRDLLFSAEMVELRGEACVVVVASDITDRKRAEEKLQQMLTQLAHVARLSTMGEMLAGVAHEVNQPLCTIVNFAKACKNLASREKPDLSQISQWSDAIAAAAAASGDIVRRMLGFARRGGATREAVSIGTLMDDAMLLVRYEARKKNVALQRDVPRAPMVVYADSTQIQQVLVNLLRNAIEALADSPPNNRRVVLKATPSGDDVRISVSDNGGGPSDLVMSKLFEPFVTTKPQGLGLGLSISKTIVEEHKGSIWAEANPGGGLSVHFTLPAGEQEHTNVP